MIKLGSKVRDLYTGFVGTAVARTEWLYSCTRITVEPLKLKKDGAIGECETFDEQRLTVVSDAKPKVAKHFKSTRPGGPQRDPKPRATPRR